MHPLEMLAQQVEWTGGNFAYNLGFIPDDKLDWKPAESALSALEVANHTIEALAQMSSVLRGGAYESQIAPATTREDAQQKLREQSAHFAQTLREMLPKELEDKIQLPWGEDTKVEAAMVNTVELAHHHGQIAYIQTLLGDTKSHFEMFGT